MHTRGLATHPTVQRLPPKSIPSVTLGNCASSNMNDHAVQSSTCIPAPRRFNRLTLT
jgi:hypothetical protein